VFIDVESRKHTAYRTFVTVKAPIVWLKLLHISKALYPVF